VDQEVGGSIPPSCTNNFKDLDADFPPAASQKSPLGSAWEAGPVLGPVNLSEWAQVANAALAGATLLLRSEAASAREVPSRDRLNHMADYLESIADQRPKAGAPSSVVRDRA
jgi:hypothetical protein